MWPRFANNRVALSFLNPYCLSIPYCHLFSTGFQLCSLFTLSNMAENNSSVSVIDTAAAQPVAKKHGKLPIRSTNTGTPRPSAKSHSTLNFSSHPFFSPPNCTKPSASSRRQQQLEFLLRNPSSSFSNSHIRYSSHRKAVRARKNFFIKRQLWKLSRQRSFKMDFIEKIREMQANESSDDEVYTFMSVSESSIASSDFASEASTAVTTPNDSDNETKPVAKAATEKKAVKTSDATESASLPAIVSKSVEPEKSEITKETKKVESPSTQPKDKATIIPSPKAIKSEKKAGKRKFDDTSSATTAEAAKQQPAAKKSKQEGKAAAAAALAQQLENQGPLPEMSSAIPTASAAAALAQQLKNQGPLPEMSSAIPTASAATSSAAPVKKDKPRGRDFQPIVAAMLDDPLGFEDQVFKDTRKPTKALKELRSELAGYHRFEKGPKPPLTMSGALGPTPPERFEAHKSDKFEPCTVNSNRREGSRVNLRPKAGYQGRQQQQRQVYGRKGKRQQQQNHNKYKKGYRFYSDGPDDDDDGDDKISTMSGAIPR
ncbi:hypothetical protein QBC38DRAFT_471635 [Podospora fimiseda]|uniref:Uncharacterized protein n=1 Tax=Podospora fimiseda TaxID=252190 RepID=A0AAN7H3A2_9PEZI|nr:hypothetical protein QBC38DRAFT_471635 [Podospora fimiseda]